MRELMFLASEPHYRAHLDPIAREMGVRVETKARPVDLSVVAGYKDLVRTKGAAVLVEHGAGQTYGNGHPSYAGGRNRDRVELFVCPSERVAELNRRAYPKAEAVAVGCPSLDRWIGADLRREVVAVAFHWDAHVAPESRSAWGHHWRGVRDLARSFEVIGHAHPRALARIEGQYRRFGIEVATYEEVMQRAGVLVADNTSLVYEYAATDRPVVLLDAPWYRREVRHGLRFWDLIPGEQVADPDGITDAVARAVVSDPYAERRREVIAEVYAYLDGKAAARAAEAIERHRR